MSPKLTGKLVVAVGWQRPLSEIQKLSSFAAEAVLPPLLVTVTDQVRMPLKVPLLPVTAADRLAGELTFCVNTGEVEPLKSALPAYTAVMLWLPRAKPEVDTLAWLLPFMLAVPKLLAPSKNCTVPVAAGVMVAVKVTELPTVDGFALELTAVVVLPLARVTVRV